MIDNPSPNQGDIKTRAHFIEELQVSNVIAFTFDGHMLSGRVVDIGEKAVTVRTKNGSIFFPQKDRIVWVLKGNRWPIGIYNALKFNKKGI